MVPPIKVYVLLVSSFFSFISFISFFFFSIIIEMTFYEMKDIRFVCLVHNTVLGAAGGALINAEMAKAKGLL